MEQSYFAGGNSGAGFFDCFDFLIPKGGVEERIVILKGGPGVGKSTLMKRVAAAAKKKKEDTELFWCSGDPDSLDAVRLKKRGILILDGTAPHSRDPVVPGAVGEILNLGEQIDRDKIRVHRDKITELLAKNGEYYRRAYGFLKAAAALSEERCREVRDCVDEKKLEGMKKRLTEGSERGAERMLFLDAITWKGTVSFAPCMVQGRHGVGIVGEHKDIVLDRLAEGMRGLLAERFLQPLSPHRTAHLLLKSGSLYLTCTEEETDETVETEEFLKKKPPEEAEKCRKEEERLVKLAVKCLKTCKSVHDELEVFYRESVDFEKVNERTELLLKSLGL